MKNWITRWLASALALFLITLLDPGIKITTHGPQQVVTVFLVVVALGLANALIRPIIMFFAWPINCLTFGLLGFAINVGLFWIVGSGLVIPGFRVINFYDALIGYVAMGAISGLINFALKDRGDRDESK